ncbi:hypothetical protein [Mesorhizobium sp. ORS 3428]|uniref:hypothetical protein n=1 Tax=Mesorhizobium sp. ORS 3428 TaxID=540997 RepID=UPI0008D9284A|nr:hypothetical protein [Mesorhizobium sp. ORS 3428]OHV88686.1 hypothetical protein ORS3428_17785 [Mesorhizobium sp. ORS 3428]
MSAAPSLRICWLVLRASAALALTVAPWHLTFDGSPRIVAASAKAGGGHGNGGGNGNGGNSGSGGGSSSGSEGGSNSGNGDNDGDSGGVGDGDGDGNGNGQGNGQGNNQGNGQSKAGSVGDIGAQGSHVNAATGDSVHVDGNKITVVHRNGMKEEIENGRFEMTDAQGRTIIERRATHEDLTRLLSL